MPGRHTRARHSRARPPPRPRSRRRGSAARRGSTATRDCRAAAARARAAARRDHASARGRWRGSGAAQYRRDRHAPAGLSARSTARSARGAGLHDRRRRDISRSGCAIAWTGTAGRRHRRRSSGCARRAGRGRRERPGRAPRRDGRAARRARPLGRAARFNWASQSPSGPAERVDRSVDPRRRTAQRREQGRGGVLAVDRHRAGALPRQPDREAVADLDKHMVGPRPRPLHRGDQPPAALVDAQIADRTAALVLPPLVDLRRAGSGGCRPRRKRREARSRCVMPAAEPSCIGTSVWPTAAIAARVRAVSSGLASGARDGSIGASVPELRGSPGERGDERRDQRLHEIGVLGSDRRRDAAALQCRADDRSDGGDPGAAQRLFQPARRGRLPRPEQTGGRPAASW